MCLVRSELDLPFCASLIVETLSCMIIAGDLFTPRDSRKFINQAVIEQESDKVTYSASVDNFVTIFWLADFT